MFEKTKVCFDLFHPKYFFLFTSVVVELRVWPSGMLRSCFCWRCTLFSYTCSCNYQQCVRTHCIMQHSERFSLRTTLHPSFVFKLLNGSFTLSCGGSFCKRKHCIRVYSPDTATENMGSAAFTACKLISLRINSWKIGKIIQIFSKQNMSFSLFFPWIKNAHKIRLYSSLK